MDNTGEENSSCLRILDLLNYLFVSIFILRNCDWSILRGLELVISFDLSKITYFQLLISKISKINFLSLLLNS